MTPAPISVERLEIDVVGDVCGPRFEMAPHPAGDYVLYSDYAALLHQLAELERELHDAEHEVTIMERNLIAAQRAREEATGLLRRVNASLYLLDKPHREFGGVTDKTATDIAAFLAASGGAREA